ncbi:MAG: hypothetical protein WCV63_05925 [Negativicutes bacterium]
MVIWIKDKWMLINKNKASSIVLFAIVGFVIFVIYISLHEKCWPKSFIETASGIISGFLPALVIFWFATRKNKEKENNILNNNLLHLTQYMADIIFILEAYVNNCLKLDYVDGRGYILVYTFNQSVYFDSLSDNLLPKLDDDLLLKIDCIAQKDYATIVNLFRTVKAVNESPRIILHNASNVLIESKNVYDMLTKRYKVMKCKSNLDLRTKEGIEQESREIISQWTKK